MNPRPIIEFETDIESDAARMCDGFNRTAPPDTSYSMRNIMPEGIFAVVRLRRLPASTTAQPQETKPVSKTKLTALLAVVAVALSDAGAGK